MNVEEAIMFAKAIGAIVAMMVFIAVILSAMMWMMVCTFDAPLADAVAYWLGIGCGAGGF